MYSGGFYSFPSQEEFWAYWSRYIFINRYQNAPKSVHEVLLELVRDKDYFVITTNVDHCFQKAGFDKKHLFYTQGDYGLFQCSEPCCQETFDNEKTVRAMVEAQGFTVADGVLTPPTDGTPTMAVPSELLPGCPHCGRPMTMSSAPISLATSHTRAATLLRALRVICGVMGVVRNSVWSQVARPVRLSP